MMLGEFTKALKSTDEIEITVTVGEKNMTKYSATRLTLPVSERDHIRGPATAPITLLEYGDYECPYCGQAYMVVEELRRQLGDRLQFVFRNFPMTQIHRQAQYAAEATEAAGAQGKFWEMHDTLFANQHKLDYTNVMQYVIMLGLDEMHIRRALTAHTYADRVREDFVSGIQSGVNGTPAFFINQNRYDGPHDLDSLLAAVEDAAEQKRR